jgi:FkbM family methyltransferase
MSDYYAQYGEDRILDRIFNKTSGTAVEVGAFDGVRGSNTYFFELKGWRTLLIEPNPDAVAAIRAIRKADVAHCAVGDCDGMVTLQIPKGSETIASVSKDAWQARRMQPAGLMKAVNVMQRRLDDVLADAGLKDIDFITIDVEGYEMNVLRGLTLDRWNPRIIILEDNTSGRSEEIPIYMEQRGYIRFQCTGCNDWYCRDSDQLATRYGLMRTEAVKALKAFKHVSLGFIRRAFASKPGRSPS